MDIRIDLTNSPQINSVASTSVSDSAEAQPSAGSLGSNQLSADTATVSQISDLVAQAMNQPEVRTDKVEAIKAQIAAGTYEIDPSKIADAIIDSALDKDA